MAMTSLCWLWCNSLPACIDLSLSLHSFLSSLSPLIPFSLPFSQTFIQFPFPTYTCTYIVAFLHPPHSFLLYIKVCVDLSSSSLTHFIFSYSVAIFFCFLFHHHFLLIFSPIVWRSQFPSRVECYCFPLSFPSHHSLPSLLSFLPSPPLFMNIYFLPGHAPV